MSLSRGRKDVSVERISGRRFSAFLTTPRENISIGFQRTFRIWIVIIYCLVCSEFILSYGKLTKLTAN